MLNEKLNNYFGWLSERGLVFPAGFDRQKHDTLTTEVAEGLPNQGVAPTESESGAGETTSQAPSELAPIPASLAEAKEAIDPAPEDPDPLQNQEAAEVDPPASEDSSDIAVKADETFAEDTIPLQGRKIVWLDEELPAAHNLHTFTRLSRALQLRDQEFAFYTWHREQDIGLLLESIASIEARFVVCFSKILGELICDSELPTIQGQWQPTAYQFRVLPAFELDQLSTNPKCKIVLWESLKKLRN